MNVLVAGGDGFVGRNVCAELVEQGHTVTSLSRSPDSSVLPDAVELISGDITNYDSIEGAFEAKDAIVNLTALPPLHQPRPGTFHDTVCIGGVMNAVHAAQEHGVARYIEMSSLGADPDSLIAYWRTQGLGDLVAQYSDLDWVILRPSFIFGEGSETFAFIKQYTTPYVTVLPAGGEKPSFQPIWVKDIAQIVADTIEEDRHVGQVYDLGGPEVLTFGEVARMLYRAEGKSIKIIPVPMRLVESALYAAEPLSIIPFGIDQARALEMTNITDHNDITDFGLEETDLMRIATYLSRR
ncbi:complex I NDUFA9 subunit family protein [Haladaptatus salinisoli]|uniref:complex I NDUFA9 subunit family protein n=1 Tax=Haladaptatus salinisoli TaxID=2884876 RepID=UPI001D09C506|nr:complex I NDUFA9 subunit family protein [Haladaptatus salinisoli]